MKSKKKQWPWGSIAYQIYPRSFKDSDGNGVGDLLGIVEKLDYLQTLGIDTVWISPFYPSPMVDFGYDITDFTNVHRLFGDLEDFDTLVAEAHTRGIRVIIDFIPNHTSDQHPWFKESRSSKESKKRDWYVWRKSSTEGQPPNNWISAFDGSAWEFDEHTQEYYLHSFAKEQPDLNWYNPQVREAQKDNMRFWFDRGVDGVRLDAVSRLAKDRAFRDEPVNPDHDPLTALGYYRNTHLYSKNGEELFYFIGELIEVVREKEGRFMITESYPDSKDMNERVDHYLRFYRGMPNAYAAPFNFEMILTDWNASLYKQYLDYFQGELSKGELSVYEMGNHDNSRLASRIGKENAKIAAMLLLTLPGLPFIYQGEEIGMENVSIPPEKAQDPIEKNSPGKGFGRDPARTPMQWDQSPYAGFSLTEPWLPVADNYRDVNVAEQQKNRESLWHAYKDLIALRKSSSALSYGSYISLDSGNKEVLAYGREYDDEYIIVMLNFSSKKQVISINEKKCSVLLDASNQVSPSANIDLGKMLLSPHSGIIVQREN